jgi:hypothetical protein
MDHVAAWSVLSTALKPCMDQAAPSTLLSNHSPDTGCQISPTAWPTPHPNHIAAFNLDLAIFSHHIWNILDRCENFLSLFEGCLSFPTYPLGKFGILLKQFVSPPEKLGLCLDRVILLLEWLWILVDPFVSQWGGGNRDLNIKGCWYRSLWLQVTVCSMSSIMR